MFEGITGRGYLGDMALDDISVLNGPCNNALSSKLIIVFFKDKHVYISTTKLMVTFLIVLDI